ncbi:uncharacterized protein BP01DRAFT_387241 [Aspergillus saccharolyticus JOP 1030-1]|uniref:C2H2-type domain-containing protein n=1 Tax=Aspergillus saccharolyticus JOP 1030-1 TaxID=1450539 RepID=A0A318Z2G6_9EURO|nr:hypothetical protein BP01DRAFT_387241 [Aspergillus saccharolyticus JOP 1030-1]PYH40574.1 hypothetical protein BP01DRAFT_387241 [Aspergillus saccharolyticus JOP 1030-1]
MNHLTSAFSTKTLYRQAQICGEMLQNLVETRVQKTLSFEDVNDRFRRFVKESQFLTSERKSEQYQKWDPETKHLFTELFRHMRFNLFALYISTRVTLLEEVYKCIDKMREHLLDSDAWREWHKSPCARQHGSSFTYAVLDTDKNDVTSQFQDLVSLMIEQMFPSIDPKLHAQLRTMIIDRRIAIGYHQHKRHRRRSEPKHWKTTRERGRSKARSSAMPDVFQWPAMPVCKRDQTDLTCPYCMTYFPVDEFDAAGWEYHVIHDVRPFLCLWDSCTSAFGSVGTWLKHMDNHRHSSTRKRSLEFKHCPFCGLREDDRGAREKSKEGLLRHIADHLETLALLALPGPMDVLLEKHIQGTRIGIRSCIDSTRTARKHYNRSERVARTTVKDDAESRSSLDLCDPENVVTPSSSKRSIRASLEVYHETDTDEHCSANKWDYEDADSAHEEDLKGDPEANPFVDQTEVSQAENSNEKVLEEAQALHCDDKDYLEDSETDAHDDQSEDETGDAYEENAEENQEDQPEDEAEDFLEENAEECLDSLGEEPEDDIAADPSEEEPEIDLEDTPEDADAEEQAQEDSPKEEGEAEPPADQESTLSKTRKRITFSKPKSKPMSRSRIPLWVSATRC